MWENNEVISLRMQVELGLETCKRLENRETISESVCLLSYFGVQCLLLTPHFGNYLTDTLRFRWFCGKDPCPTGTGHQTTM